MALMGMLRVDATATSVAITIAVLLPVVSTGMYPFGRGNVCFCSNRVEEVKGHPYFADLNWDDVYDRKAPSPAWAAQIWKNEADIRCFDPVFTKEAPVESVIPEDQGGGKGGKVHDYEADDIFHDFGFYGDYGSEDEDEDAEAEAGGVSIF